MKPVWGRFVVAVVAGLLAGAATALGLPFMIKYVFPLIFVSEETGRVAEVDGWMADLVRWWTGGELDAGVILVMACLMLPVVFLVRGVMGFVNVYWLTFVGMRVVEGMRLRAFERLQFLSLGFHARHKAGDLMARVMEDSGMLRKALVRVCADLVVQPATLIFAVGYLVWEAMNNEGAMFMLLALSTVPLCVLPLRALGSLVVKRARRAQKESGGLAAILSENLGSQQEIRAYNLQQRQMDGFEGVSNRYIRFTMKTVKYNRLIGPMVEIVSAVAVGFAIYIGAQRGMTLEVFIPMVVALYAAYDPIKRLGAVHGHLKHAEASLERLEVITESDDELLDPVEPKDLGDVRGEVVFRDVEFGYGGEPVLRGLNLQVEPGEVVALVGPSGAGKSTFVSLIPRFYDVTGGAVVVDGVDVREVAKSELREQIALVSQHPLLFSGTIAENISVGRPGASREEVEEAARLACADGFVRDFPDGYETVLGERGEGLSGGQRQRIAIARAFLKDAPILILDEATSALDTESEAQIQEALRELAKGRTTFMIAHRFSSIRDAGRILVFERGEVVADGSHGELMEGCGLYRDLYERQGGN